MKLRIVIVSLASTLALALNAGEKNSSPKPDGAFTPPMHWTAQDITYCCGNHTDKTEPQGPHCGSRGAMIEFEKKYQCNKWRVRGHSK